MFSCSLVVHASLLLYVKVLKVDDVVISGKE